MKKVKIDYSGEIIEGTLIKEKPNVVVKLDSGYNIGLDKKKIKKMEIKEIKKTTKKSSKIKNNAKLETISIMHTGGTIASKVDYETGAVVALFKPEEILELFPELSKIANISCVEVANIQSDDMRFEHWNLIADSIKKEMKKKPKGIIITQGTDTLHYTASAMAFALEGINIPVVVTGSQRSSDRPSSDAGDNLLNAAYFISKTQMKGVFVCMHETINDSAAAIMHGVNCRKMHSSRRDAFKPIDLPIAARVDYKQKEYEPVSEVVCEEKFTIKPFNPKLKIGLCKIHPQFFAAELDAYEKFDGLVIEGTGFGHMPITEGSEHKKILKKIDSLAKKIPVVISTQTIGGRVNLNVYSPGRVLLETGVIGNYTTMTPETAFVKLAWLLSNYKKNEIVQLYSENLRGENPDFLTNEGFE